MDPFWRIIGLQCPKDANLSLITMDKKLITNYVFTSCILIMFGSIKCLIII